jgi:predicted metal-dependent peptidase
MLERITSLIFAMDRRADSYSRGLQAARVRAAYQRAYFGPALFALVPVKTDLIASMAVDTKWRLYYNDSWVATHSVEQNAAVLIHEVSHLLRDHEQRKKAASANAPAVWNTAADCEINDDLLAEGLPLPDDPPHPEKLGLEVGQTAENYYEALTRPPSPSASARPADAGGESAGRAASSDTPKGLARASASRAEAEGKGGRDCGSGAHGERRPWELLDEELTSSGQPGVDPVKVELVRRDVAKRILDTSGDSGDVPLGWRRWAHTVLTPKVDYMATIRHAVRRAIRESTLGRYDRTYKRPHRRQGCYGEFIMPSFYQPRPKPGFLIDTSSSMQDTQLARAIAELGGLTRQLGYGTEVVVACCDTVVHDVRKAFNAAQVQLYGGGGTDISVGVKWFTDRKGTIDLLVIVSDCHTAWPEGAPPFPVITIRVGDGVPPPWGDRGANKVITIEVEKVEQVEKWKKWKLRSTEVSN